MIIVLSLAKRLSKLYHGGWVIGFMASAALCLDDDMHPTSDRLGLCFGV